MVSALLSKFGWLEVFFRCSFDKFPKLKEKIKKKKKKTEKVVLNEKAWQIYQQKVEEIIGENQIVLIHSSMDGLSGIGVTAVDVLDFLLKLVDKKNTIVIPTFPVTNLRVPTPKSSPYDPQKTLCWTGMLPNLFIGTPGVIRSVYPYNTLAAIGHKAKEMMAQNDRSIYIYDENSAWAYCVNHNAKILFIGTSASKSNTIGIHMVPDIMKDQWPITDWYEERIYRVRHNNSISEKKVMIQRAKWYKYCMEHLTAKRLKETFVLKEKIISGCYLGYVDDASMMVNTLVEFCKQGKLMYLIPKKYYKKERNS